MLKAVADATLGASDTPLVVAGGGGGGGDTEGAVDGEPAGGEGQAGTSGGSGG